MRGSIGLKAYRALTRRRPPAPFKPAGPRPEGELIWFHAAEAGRNRALRDLAQRLISMRQQCHVLMTSAHAPLPTSGSEMIHMETLPDEHPDTTAAFIDHWKPDVVIWAWGGLRPNLIQSAADSGAKMMLIDAEEDGFDSRRDRWLPEVPRQLVARFDTVIVRSRAAHMRLAQLGCPFRKITQAQPLRPFGRMLPAAESDLVDVTQALGGRPVWLAMRVSRGEVGMVLAAQRQALKASHRLLLILYPADQEDVADILAKADTIGLRTLQWSDGHLPDDNIQILIADTGEDLGLWLRLAPVSFLGSSLVAGQTSCDPYMAAAHGTAIIYGPHTGSHVEAYSSLMTAGAARIVNDASTLGRAVIQMMAPDLAAQMAMAGWDVVTESADSLDSIIAEVENHLDGRPRGTRE